MALTPITLADGRTIEFDVDTEARGPTYFVMSVRKCGSTMFNNICGSLAQLNDRHVVDVSHGFFTANVREIDYLSDPALQGLIHPGNCYRGFRGLPLCLCGHEMFERALKALMIRDPRDALVSLYFSTAFSHPIPAPAKDGRDDVGRMLVGKRIRAQQTSIQLFVRNHARGMLNTMDRYRRIMDDPLLTVLRYEDYIFDKRAMMLRVAGHFGWKIDEDQISRILERTDVRPKEENAREFIRKVTPGDHKEKLSRRTIAEITEILRPAMDMFGYEP